MNILIRSSKWIFNLNPMRYSGNIYNCDERYELCIYNCDVLYIYSGNIYIYIIVTDYIYTDNIYSYILYI